MTAAAKILIGLGLLVSAYGACVWINIDRSYAPDPVEPYKPIVRNPNRLLYNYDAQWKRGRFGNLFIASSVKNESGKAYRYAQISFNVFDKNGAQVGNALANVTGLDPGRVWKFEAVVINEERAETFDFHELKGW